MSELDQHDLETRYGRKVVKVCFVSLLVGFVIGLVVGLGSATVVMLTPLGAS